MCVIKKVDNEGKLNERELVPNNYLPEHYANNRIPGLFESVHFGPRIRLTSEPVVSNPLPPQDLDLNKGDTTESDVHVV